MALEISIGILQLFVGIHHFISGHDFIEEGDFFFDTSWTLLLNLHQVHVGLFNSKSLVPTFTKFSKMHFMLLSLIIIILFKKDSLFNSIIIIELSLYFYTFQTGNHLVSMVFSDFFLL